MTDDLIDKFRALTSMKKHIELEAETARPKRCRWNEDEEFDWVTGCGNRFMFIFAEGGPTQNGMKFCPYCGGELVTDEPKGE